MIKFVDSIGNTFNRNRFYNVKYLFDCIMTNIFHKNLVYMIKNFEKILLNFVLLNVQNLIVVVFKEFSENWTLLKNLNLQLSPFFYPDSYFSTSDEVKTKIIQRHNFWIEMFVEFCKKFYRLLSDDLKFFFEHSYHDIK